MRLADYILGLVEAVEQAEPASAARLRGIVGDRSAIIAVDREAVRVSFRADRVLAAELEPGPLPAADGIGETDRGTVLALLDGRIEVTQAIKTDRLRLHGKTDGIVRMSRAIEILIDVAVRGPLLQQLAAAYRSEPGEAALAPEPPADAARRQARLRRAELAMLGRLGLLPRSEGEG